MVTMALYNIIDTFWVSGLGHEAIAALTVIMPFSILMMAIGGGTGVGVSSLVARRFGEQNVKATNQVAGQIFPLTLLFGVLFLVAAVGFPETILKLCGATPDIMDYARQYLTVIGYGGITVFFGIVAMDMLRGSGDAVRPMIFMVSAAVLNTVLDPFLIFGWWIFPEMGVSGAALATVISQGLAGVMCLFFILSKKTSYRVRLADLRPDFRIIREIYRVGLPSMLTQITESITFLLLNNLLAGFTSMAIAAVGIIMRVVDFAFMPIIGISNGLLPITGYNFGARKWKRMWAAFRLAVTWLVILMSIATVGLMIFAPQLIGIFNKEPEFLEIAVPAMRIMIAMLPVIGVVIAVTSMFQGMGKGLAVLFLSLSRQLIFFVPAMYIMSHFWGLTGVWISMPFSDFCGIAVSVPWALWEYRRMRKRPDWETSDR